MRGAAVLRSDGVLTELEDIARVARTVEGPWAIPITIDREDFLFPCSTYSTTAELLRFRLPRPRKSLI